MRRREKEEKEKEKKRNNVKEKHIHTAINYGHKSDQSPLTVNSEATCKKLS